MVLSNCWRDPGEANGKFGVAICFQFPPLQFKITLCKKKKKTIKRYLTNIVAFTEILIISS